MMHGRSFQRGSLRMAASTSRPVRCGIIRSRRTSPMSPSRSSTSSASRPSYARVTRKGPCSSFILMIRPMCGSSSATSTCAEVDTERMLDQRGDVLAITPQLVQELSDVRAGLHEHEQDGLGGQNRHDRHPLLMFEDDRDDFTPGGRSAKFVGGTDDGWDPRREILRIQSGNRLTVDQQAVATEDDGCVDTLALAQCGYQIANARHACSVG